MKLKTYLSAASVFVSVSAAFAQFDPVPLTPGSYTFGIVVPSNTVYSVPACVNAFAGSGTCFNCDTTFYEQTLYARPGNTGANSGIPIHNTVFTSTNNNNKITSFLMPPDYTTNNDLMIVSSGQYGSIPSGAFTFATPVSATSLAILCSGGNGGNNCSYTVTFTNNATQTGSISVQDWFNGGATVAWGANGRMDQNGGFDNFSSSGANTGAPYLYANLIAINNTNEISSIAFTYVSGGGVANYYAVSASANGTTYSPVQVSGYNVISTIAATIPFPVTATMDGGTNVNVGNGPGNTWFEQGYYQTNTSYGLPPSGSIFASMSQPTHFYQMGSYSANNATLIDKSHLSSDMTPITPGAYTAFAFLTAGANIGSTTMKNVAVLQHLDGVNETNAFLSYDWFNTAVSGAVAWEANGRVNMNNRTLNNIGNTTPNLFESYFPLNDTNSPVTNIIVEYGTAPANNSTTYVLAVSGTTNPVAPLIVQNPTPATQTWYASQTATLSVIVAGTAPVTNIWLVESNGVFVPLTDGVDANGSTISGSSTTTLTISDLTLDDATNYEFAASNSVGGQISATAAILINTGAPYQPIIDDQSPTVATIDVLTNHPDVTTFSVTIDPVSAVPVTYQWYNGAAPIAGATNSTYANVDTNNGASLYCIASNFVGTATSSPVAIVIVPQPALTPYQAAIAAYHPAGYWPLNETSGNIAFDYVGTNDGTYLGTFLMGLPGIPATAGIGANFSVNFDGSTAYVDIPVANLNITNAITVIAWVQTPAGGESGGHFGTVVGHSDQSYRLTVVNTAPRFADAGPDDVGTANVGDGNWHQVVGVYDGTNQYVYADGQQTGPTVKSSPAGSPDDVWIAAAPDYAGGRNFNGNLCQIAILTNALTAAQVASVYYSLGLPPVVSVTPASPSIYAGTGITFTADTNGTPPLSLQWYSIDDSGNSNNISGATGDTYTVSDAAIGLNGYTYGVNVSNIYGVASASQVLTVQNGPPYLLTGGDIPVLYGVAYAGAPVTYTVGVAGSAPLFYQWLVNGVAVSGATNSSFTEAAECGSSTIQVEITNAYSGGTPTLSSIATLQSEDYPTNITFNTDGTGWKLNPGSSIPTIAANVLELTDGNGGEGSSVFYSVPQYIGSFNASFTYTAGGNAAADGVCFVLQESSAGSNALGGSGGALGYNGITSSAALEINIYSGNGLGGVGIAFGTNGNIADVTAPGQVHVSDGDPIGFQLSYGNGVLAVTLTDPGIPATYSTNIQVGSLTEILGGTSVAYVGFTGGDGGATSIQTISDFVFTPVIPSESLTVSPVTAGSFTLSWPAADPNFVLEQSANLSTWIAGPTPVAVGGTNQVTVTVPTGGGDLFYRLQRIVCQ